MPVCWVQMFMPANPNTSVQAGPCAGYKYSCQPARVLSTSVHASPCAEYKCPCQPVCWVPVFMPARVLSAIVFVPARALGTSVQASPGAGYKCSCQSVLGTRFMSVRVLSTSVHASPGAVPYVLAIETYKLS